jgi:hypothetical protein
VTQCSRVATARRALRHVTKRETSGPADRATNVSR